jgi:hypothetical protein
MFFMPSLIDVLFVSASLGILLTLQGYLLGEDGDSAWNLRIGEYILAHGLPRTEFMLSSTLGHPTLYYEWLAQLVYALALHLGGLNGVVALAAVLVGLDVTLLFWALRRRGVPLLLALFLTLVGAWLTTSVWTARAQQFTLLLTLVWSELLWSYWRTGDRRLLWLFPLSAALWANLHPGFVGGLLMLLVATVIAWVFPARYRGGVANPRSLGLTFVAALAATLINPWGVELWRHIVAYLGDPLVLATTSEYLSPDFHTLYAQVFLLMLFLLVASWLWLARTGVPSSSSSPPELPFTPPTTESMSDFQVAVTFSPLAIALSAVWTLLALQSVRFVALWAVTVLPILGVCLTLGLRTLSDRQYEKLDLPLLAWGLPALRRLGRLNARDEKSSHGLWALLGLIVVLGLLLNGGSLPGSRSPVLQARFDAHTFPVAAAQRLAQNGLPSGNGFTTYTWGSYLDYALPAFHPFVDSRSDAYGHNILQEYLDVVGIAPNWSALLDRYHIRWALLPVDTPLAQVLALRPGWTCRPADDVGVAVLCQERAGT